MYRNLFLHRWGRSRETVFLAVLVFCVATSSVAQTGVDLAGHAVNPFASASGNVVVLVFVRRDCPVSSRYAPVIERISAEYEHDASFWLVYPDKTDSPAAIRQYLSDYGYHLPALRDPSQSLVKISHVRVTPEVAVFDREHRLVYDGRIDNWYVDLTRSRAAPTTHELADAIRAAAQDKPLATHEIRGVGCYISDIE